MRGMPGSFAGLMPAGYTSGGTGVVLLVLGVLAVVALVVIAAVAGASRASTPTPSAQGLGAMYLGISLCGSCCLLAAWACGDPHGAPWMLVTFVGLLATIPWWRLRRRNPGAARKVAWSLGVAAGVSVALLLATIP